MNLFRASPCLGAVLLFTAACTGDAQKSVSADDLTRFQSPRQPNFGDPLAGLGADDTARFEAGQEEFAAVETVEEGLGPVFNEASCATCHVGPNGAIGGTNQRLETRFGFKKNV